MPQRSSCRGPTGECNSHSGGFDTFFSEGHQVHALCTFISTGKHDRKNREEKDSKLWHKVLRRLASLCFGSDPLLFLPCSQPSSKLILISFYLCARLISLCSFHFGLSKYLPLQVTRTQTRLSLGQTLANNTEHISHGQNYKLYVHSHSEL